MELPGIVILLLIISVQQLITFPDTRPIEDEDSAYKQAPPYLLTMVMTIKAIKMKLLCTFSNTVTSGENVSLMQKKM